jgi:pimeloyl-ACP methyl ester carboxylesterase
MSMEFIVDGYKVHAATGGRPFDPAKPCVIFLHGAGMDHTVWSLQSRYFAHHGRSVLAIDLPGHGRSDGEALPTIAELADWVARLIAAAGIAKAGLIGHSLGALIALETAARYPNSVEKLALLGVAGKMPVHPDMLASAKANTREVIDLMVSWAHGRTNHFGQNAMPGNWTMNACWQLIARSRPGVIHTDLFACNAYKDAPAMAEKLACPTILILAAEDIMTPAKAGKELGKTTNGAQIEIIPNCGHMMMSERPDETLDRLKGLM